MAQDLRFGSLYGSEQCRNGTMDAFKLILVSLAGWMNRQQQHVIEYLQEEVRVLKEQQVDARPRFTDDQRRRLARKAKLIRYGLLKEIVGLVTPQTLLAWHRKLIAKKYDSSGVRRRVGRRPTAVDLRDLVIRVAEENRGWGYTRIRGGRLQISVTTSGEEPSSAS
ncbi:MAG: putative transposase [Pseudoalteromonas tetraodonis]|jgi:putative transposase